MGDGARTCQRRARSRTADAVPTVAISAAQRRQAGGAHGERVDERAGERRGRVELSGQEDLRRLVGEQIPQGAAAHRGDCSHEHGRGDGQLVRERLLRANQGPQPQQQRVDRCERRVESRQPPREQHGQQRRHGDDGEIERVRQRDRRTDADEHVAQDAAAHARRQGERERAYHIRLAVDGVQRARERAEDDSGHLDRYGHAQHGNNLRRSATHSKLAGAPCAESAAR